MSQWGSVTLAGLTMCSLAFLLAQAVDVHEEYSHLVQTSNRYIRELQRNVARTEYLESHYDLPQTSRRNKRSLEPDLNLKTSLLVFCDSLTHPGKYSVPGSKDSQKSEEEKEMEKEEVVMWQQSNPKPVKVELSRIKDSITVSFTVNATFPFQAIRATPMWESNDDTVEKEVIVPTSMQGMPVSFTFPDTRCREGSDEEEEFHFRQATRNANDRLFLYLDVCQLKPKNNSNGSLEYLPMSQDITLPRFDISGAEKEILLIPGRNTSIDFDVDFKHAQFVVSAFLYNSRTKTTIIAGIRASVSKLKLETRPTERGAPGYFQLEEIENKEGKKNEENKGEGTSGAVSSSPNENKRKSLRLTLSTESGDLSGVVMPLLFKYYYESDNDIVDRTAETKVLKLQNHNEKQPFPEGTFFFTSKPKTSCMWEHQENYDGKPCKVGCYVIGQDITSLTLTKMGDDCFSRHDAPHSKPLHSYMQSSAVLNLGSSGLDIQGNYLCKVKDKHGNTGERIIKLVLGGWPRLNHTTSRIKNLGNGTSEITCVGYGALPLHTEIVMKKRNQEEKTRIDEHAITKVDEESYRITTRVYLPSDSITGKLQIQCTLRSALGKTRATLYQEH